MKKSIQTKPKNQKKREKTPRKLNHKTKGEEREQEEEETKQNKAENLPRSSLHLSMARSHQFQKWNRSYC
jgi:hypothetical protein